MSIAGPWGEIYSKVAAEKPAAKPETPAKPDKKAVVEEAPTKLKPVPAGLDLFDIANMRVAQEK